MTKPSLADRNELELQKIAMLRAMSAAWSDRPCVVSWDAGSGKITTEKAPPEPPKA